MKKLALVTVLTVGALSLMAAGDAKSLVTKCAGCHGADFGKKALGVSKVVKGMKAEEIEKALKGYKAGTFGGAMKGVMKGQVAGYNDEQIKTIAEYISKIK